VLLGLFFILQDLLAAAGGVQQECSMQIKTIAIIGAGTMGRGIAYASALGGYTTVLEDVSDSMLSKAVAWIRESLDEGVRRGKVEAAARDAALARITTSQVVDEAIRDAELIIEAVPEELEMKLELFTIFDKFAKPNAIFASNTSSLSISDMSELTVSRERCLGMHFFNPAQLTKLVEIIRGESTSPQTIEKASQIVREIGKTPIIAQDEPGFIANRLGLTLYVEASKLQEDGIASLQDIDTCMKLGYNHPMGPFELADFVGLDTRLRNLESLYRSTNDSKWIPPKLLREMVQQGYLGDPSRKKTSKGGYYEFLQIERRQSSNPLYRTQTTNHR